MNTQTTFWFPICDCRNAAVLLKRPFLLLPFMLRPTLAMMSVFLSLLLALREWAVTKEAQQARACKMLRELRCLGYSVEPLPAASSSRA